MRLLHGSLSKRGLARRKVEYEDSFDYKRHRLLGVSGDRKWMDDSSIMVGYTVAHHVFYTARAVLDSNAAG